MINRLNSLIAMCCLVLLMLAGTAVWSAYTEPPRTASVETIVAAPLSGVVNVKDHGAVGDGVADDTAAIQAALDAVADGPCRLLEFEPGATYKVSSTLAMTMSWTIRQCQINGNNAVIVSHTTGPLFDVSGNACSVMRDLRLKSHSKGKGIALYASPDGSEYAGQACYQSIEIRDFEEGLHWGSDTKGANGGWSTNFIDLDIGGCVRGLVLQDGGNNALVFLGLRSASNDVGVDIRDHCSMLKFVGGVIEANRTAAVRISGGGEKFVISFDGIYFESLSTDVLLADNTSNLRNCSFANCYFFSAAKNKTAVFATGKNVSASNFAVRNCFIYLSASSAYGSLPDGSIIDNNFAPFENTVGGRDLLATRGRAHPIPATTAGKPAQVTTGKSARKGTSFNWKAYHANNDGGYAFRGTCFVTQDGIPLHHVDFAKKADGSAAAPGTIKFDTDGGLVRFSYTPPDNVKTVAGSELVIHD